MAISIGSNISALNAQRRLAEATSPLNRTLERLSSGQRINHASDDAAGLAISEALGAQSKIYSQAVRNANDGISLLNIAEGALNELSQIVIRQKELAEQASNGVYSGAQRNALQDEANALVKEYNRIAATTNFNGIGVLDGTMALSGLRVQLGAGTAESISFNLNRELGHSAGTGTFTTAVSTGDTSSAGNIFTAASADFNNDGFLDLVVGSSDGAVRYQLGNGDGTFQAVRSAAAGLGASVIAATVTTADMNNDGNIDLVVAGIHNSGTGSSTIGVLYGSGAGTFAPGVSYSAGSGSVLSPSALSVVDFNNDGLLDVIGKYADDQSLRLWAGTGGGRLSSSTQILHPTLDLESDVGDINGDGILDIVLGVNRFGGQYQVMLGNGDGTVRTGTTVGPSGLATGSAALIDFNNDDKLDFVVHNYTQAVVNLFLGNGDGTFLATRTMSYSPSGGNAATVQNAGDLNDDGVDDLLVSAFYSGESIVVLGNNAGTMSINQTFTSGGQSRNSAGQVATFGDFDGNGVIDIVKSGMSTNPFITSGVVDQNRYAVRMAKLDFTSIPAARNALNYLNQVLTKVTKERGTIGAAQSRIGSAQSLLSTTILNTQSARSRILDADIAEESAALVRNKILQQATIGVLAQANQQPQVALQLIGAVKK